MKGSTIALDTYKGRMAAAQITDGKLTDLLIEAPEGVVQPGAIFRVATDIPDYVRQTLTEVPRHGFEWLAETADDWRQPWGDWISTRYEQKALREGRTPHYLTFRRLG